MMNGGVTFVFVAGSCGCVALGEGNERCERRKGLTVGQWAYFIPFCGVVSTETAVLIATTAKQLTTTGSEATQQPTTKQPQ